MSEKVVVKFGGSNLKEIRSVDQLIRVIKMYENPPVVVVSAFYGITNLLIDILECVLTDPEKVKITIQEIREIKLKTIDYYFSDEIRKTEVSQGINKLLAELEKYLYGISYIGEIPDFLSDKILSYGERLSSFCLNAIFNYLNIKSEERLPDKIGLITNGELGDASIDFKLSSKKFNGFEEDDCVYIVPGFYGISMEGKVNLLGRGGTDYAAASIARLLNAKSLDIWKDVDGFMSADPKFVNNPVRICHLSYSEAAELAYFGAKILHPRTVEPLIDCHIPVRIFNIENAIDVDNPLTLVNSDISSTDRVIKSITSSDSFGLLKLNGLSVGIKAGILARITEALNRNSININSVITSQISINLLLAAKDLIAATKHIQDLELMEIQEIIPFNEISVIAVVGQGILEKPGIGARIFTAVAEKNINISMSTLGGSDVVCYLIVNRLDKKTAISQIHNEFFNTKKR